MPQSKLMPSILDREITAKADDAFGHQDFANALRSSIESEHNQPPYSIGLLGPWGTGKSTIKSLYLRDLFDDTRKTSNGKKRSERIKALTFNAWRYGGDSNGNMKRALLRHVFLGLGGSQENLKDELYHQISKNYEKARVWRTALGDLSRKVVLNLLPTIILLGILLAFFAYAIKHLNINNDMAKAVFAITGSVLSVSMRSQKNAVHGIKL